MKLTLQWLSILFLLLIIGGNASVECPTQLYLTSTTLTGLYSQEYDVKNTWTKFGEEGEIVEIVHTPNNREFIVNSYVPTFDAKKTKLTGLFKCQYTTQLSSCENFLQSCSSNW
jgi:hypothetical protein